MQHRKTRALLEEIRSTGPKLADFEAQASDKAWAAFDALEKFRNPSSVDFLSRVFHAGGLGGIDCVAAGHALAAMGHPAGTRACLGWVQAQTQDVSPLVDGWLGRMRDRASVRLVDWASKDGAFANELNKVALGRVLAEWHANRVSD